MSAVRRIAFGALALAAACASALACADDDATSAGFDGAASGSPPASDAASPPREIGAPSATMRLAHLAPDVERIDFCYRATGTGAAYQGPVFGRAPLRRDAGTDAGEDTALDAGGDEADARAPAVDAAVTEPPDAETAIVTSLASGTMTRYLALDVAGTLDVAIVPAGSSCASPLVKRTLTLDPGKLTTVVLLGRRDTDAGSAAELGLVALVDDRTTDPDRARVRMVHAALHEGAVASLAVRAVAGTVVPLAERVDPRKASAASEAVPVDSLGYATVAPLVAPASLVASPTGPGAEDAGFATWESAPSDLGLRAGALRTGFLLLGAERTLEVLWCDDALTTGDRTACVRVR